MTSTFPSRSSANDAAGNSIASHSRKTVGASAFRRMQTPPLGSRAVALLHGGAVLLEPAGQRRELRRRVARATTNAMRFLWHTHEDRLDTAHFERLVVLLRLRHRRAEVFLPRHDQRGRLHVLHDRQE